MDKETEVVDEGLEVESNFNPLDEMIKDLDGPDLEGDLEEGDVSTEGEDKSGTEDGEESQKVGEDQPASEEEAEGKTEDEEAGSEEAQVEDEVDPRDEEIRRLRAKTREQEKDGRALRQKVESLDRKLTESGLVKDEEEEGSEGETPEEAAMRIKLETLAETMKLNPNYSDLDDVVTEDRYNDTIEGAVARLIEDGYGKDEAYNMANDYVWSRPNPYKYMYELIKKGHPDFAEKEVAGDDKKADSTAKDKADKPKKEVAPSIGKVPGSGGKDAGGWTAARIDDLPEGRLNEVPPATYEKYLAGELD